MDKQSITRARRLRREQTPAEKILWTHLRGRRFDGFRFRRQQPIGKFIADFYCSKAALIVELDGDTHIGREAPDQARAAWLEAQGYKVLRIWNSDIYDALYPALEQIHNECVARAGRMR